MSNTESESTDSTEPEEELLDAEQPDEELDDAEVPLHEMDPDEVSVEDLEDQEWTLGGGPVKELINFKGTTFLIQEPDDDDTILNMMAESELGVGDTSDRMYQLCNEAIRSPELTTERWRDLTQMERIGLMMRVSAALGMGDMLDFQELGRELQQEDSQS